MLRKWMKSEKGAVLPFIGLAFFVLLLSVGLAIDYARALIVKERMQWALDAGALAGTKKAPQGQDVVQATAQQYFDANFPQGHMSTSRALVSAQPIASADRGGHAYRFTVSNVSMDAYIMNVVGLNNIGVGAATEVNTLPLTPLDVVFSVDMSGSMLVTAGAGCTYLPYGAHCYEGTDKLTDAKVAMGALIDQVDSGTTDTRFGIVPWSSYVNPIGAIAGTFTRRTCYDGQRATYVADENPSRTWEGNASTIGSTNLPMWNANQCREYSANTIRNVGSLRPMVYLTTDVARVRSAINDLKAEANTDGALGMYWSYAMLELQSRGWINWRAPSMNKSIILLTDGNNTKYWRNPGQANPNVTGALSNARQEELCKLAKDKNITVYTIAYDMDDNDPVRLEAKAMLNRCASSTCPTRPGNKCYFDARYPSQLDNAMRSIGDTMMTMRVTR